MSTRFSLADLVIDLKQNSVRRRHRVIRLTDLSFSVLAALVKKAPHPVSSKELAIGAWHTPHVTDETIAQRITLLRRALGDNPRTPRYVKTIRGFGYVCAGPVRTLAENRPTLKTLSWNAPASIAAALAVASVTFLIHFLVWNAPNGSGLIGSEPPSVVSSLVDRARAQLEVQQEEETDRAISLLRRAFVLDSSDPRVHITLSFALSTRATKFRARDEDIAEAKAMARYAIFVDADSGGAWHALGYALDASGRVDEALSAYRHAFDLDPTDFAAMSSAAYLLSIRGRLYDALVLEARAMDGERYSRYAEIQIALTLDLIDHPAARRWRSRASMLNPNQVVVLAAAAESHLRKGDPDAALKVLAESSEHAAENPRLLLLSGRANLANGDWITARADFVAAGEQASSELAALNSMAGTGASLVRELQLTAAEMLDGDSWPGLRVQVAELHAANGDDVAALSLLSQAVDLGWRDAGALEQSPFLQQTLDLAAWAKIRQRIERELTLQRTLIEGAPGLARILKEKDQGT